MSDYTKYGETFHKEFYFQHKRSLSAEKETPHIHRDFELLFVQSHGICCQINDKCHSLKKDTLLIFNGMDLHRIYPTGSESYDRYVFFFKPEYIQGLSSVQTNLLHCFYFRPFDLPQILPLTPQEGDEIRTMMMKIENASKCSSADMFGNDLILKFLLGHLLIRVNQLYQKQHNIIPQNQDKYDRIYEVIKYIHNHFAEDITLDLLVEEFYINKSYLCTLFKQVTGISPMQYIIHCRLMKAKHLLATNIPVDEVCGQVGYNNLSHFSRAFTKYAGIGPKKYQMAMAQDQKTAAF